MLPLYRACQRMCVRLANDLFLHDDLRAHRRGWTVEPIRNGTGRRYRDPRWDRVSECSCCVGAGFRGIQTCPSCAGRGVVDALAAPAEPVAAEQAPLKVVAERLDLPPGTPR